MFLWSTVAYMHITGHQNMHVIISVKKCKCITNKLFMGQIAGHTNLQISQVKCLNPIVSPFHTFSYLLILCFMIENIGLFLKHLLVLLWRTPIWGYFLFWDSLQKQIWIDHLGGKLYKGFMKRLNKTGCLNLKNNISRYMYFNCIVSIQRIKAMHLNKHNICLSKMQCVRFGKYISSSKEHIHVTENLTARSATTLTNAR